MVSESFAVVLDREPDEIVPVAGHETATIACGLLQLFKIR